jgi:hypothetical protein
MVSSVFKSATFDGSSGTGGTCSSNVLSNPSSEDIFTGISVDDIINGSTQYRKIFIKPSFPQELTSDFSGPFAFILNTTIYGDRVLLSQGTNSDSLPSISSNLWYGSGAFISSSGREITFLPDGSTDINTANTIPVSTVAITNMSSFVEGGHFDFYEVSSVTGVGDGSCKLVLTTDLVRVYDSSFKVLSLCKFSGPLNSSEGIPLWIKRIIPEGCSRAETNPFSVGVIWNS